MKYAIDKIENNLALLENLNTKEKKEVPLELLPLSIKEGTILYFSNDTYIIDDEETINRRQSLQSRFANLKKKGIRK